MQGYFRHQQGYIFASGVGNGKQQDKQQGWSGDLSTQSPPDNSAPSTSTVHVRSAIEALQSSNRNAANLTEIEQRL